MDFKDPKEREAVLGPLFATEAKAAVPVFGEEKLSTNQTNSLVNISVQKALQSVTRSVINLLEPVEPDALQTSSSLTTESLGEQFEHLNMSKNGVLDPEHHDTMSGSMYSSRELHDKSHYTSLSSKGHTKIMGDQFDNVLLRRAKQGYLFDCTLNKKVVSDDIWLRDVWDWIEGKFILQSTDKSENVDNM
jgi:hypothetical protein